MPSFSPRQLACLNRLLNFLQFSLSKEFSDFPFIFYSRWRQLTPIGSTGWSKRLDLYCVCSQTWLNAAETHQQHWQHCLLTVLNSTQSQQYFQPKLQTIKEQHWTTHEICWLPVAIKLHNFFPIAVRMGSLKPKFKFKFFLYFHPSLLFLSWATRSFAFHYLVLNIVLVNF